MGKKQHQKDKMYLTASEWSQFYGGHKAKSVGPSQQFRRLPFDCCALSFQPFEFPYCTAEGVIFDLTNVVPFLKKYGVSPVSGKKLSAKDLTKLNFHKNKDGKYHCPVTFRIFNENTHIVAVATTGNVYAYEAVEKLNIKASYWKDLLNDEPFARKDLITIQDPGNLAKFNLSAFHHVKHGLKVVSEEEIAARKDPRAKLKAVSAETRDILDQLDRDYKPAEREVVEEQQADSLNAASYSTGKVAASFTATTMGTETKHQHAIIKEDVLRYERVKKKGYVRLVTSHGQLNLELHCELVTRTCDNFLRHASSGYYTGTKFHRSIRNFMIQGGDPTGTGTGGESAWGGTFKDEFRSLLSHSGRGILSMANAGPNTNKSQFFITFRSCKHLDGKHTVFGRVVGGLDTLDRMEAVATDANDAPQEEIKIEAVQVFANPFDDATAQIAKERAQEKERLEAEAAKFQPKPKPEVSAERKQYGTGVGKYLDTKALKRQATQSATPSAETSKKKSKASSGFSDFSAW